MMNRVVPHPLLSALLLIVWVLLMNEATVGNVVLGTILGLALPPLLANFRPPLPPIRRPAVLVRLLAVVLWDIVIANVQVAMQVLQPNRSLKPAFVQLPLSVTSDATIAMLASIISLTPGTVSADLSRDRRRLLIHTLSVDDGEALLQQIKTRYEAPLLEVFGC